jgi:hypothetical protein
MRSESTKGCCFLRQRVSARQWGYPRGQAVVEYLAICVMLVLAWILLERSPGGLFQAFITMMGRFSFSLSIPW